MSPVVFGRAMGKWTPGLVTPERIACSFEEKRNLIDDVLLIYMIHELVSRRGLLKLEDEYGLNMLEDHLLRTSLQAIADGTDPETVMKIMEALLFQSRERGAPFLRKLIYCEGVLSIQAGDHGPLLLTKLGMFLGEEILREILRVGDVKRTNESPHGYEEDRHRLEMLFLKTHPLREKEPEGLVTSPCDLHDRALQRIAREMGEGDMIELLILSQTPARKKILRVFSRNTIRRLIKKLERYPNSYSSIFLDLIDRWESIVRKLEDAGEISVSRKPGREK